MGSPYAEATVLGGSWGLATTCDWAYKPACNRAIYAQSFHKSSNQEYALTPLEIMSMV